MKHTKCPNQPHKIKVKLPGLGLICVGEGTVPTVNKKSMSNKEMFDSLKEASTQDYFDKSYDHLLFE